MRRRPGPPQPARRCTPALRPAGAEGAHPITITITTTTIDADIAPGRQVKSIEIGCKIEYS